MESEPGWPQFGILGWVTAWHGQRELDLGPVKQRAVLAVLALHPGQLVGHDRIINAVWGPEPPPSAANLVHKYVSGLRRIVEPGWRTSAVRVLDVVSAAGYLLRVPAGRTDLGAFEERARSAGADRGEAAVAGFRAALGLWRGPALDGLTGPYFDTERLRLGERRLAVWEECLAREIALGRCAELIGELSGLVGTNPMREGLVGLLMLALYGAGRKAEALATYRDVRRRLVGDLGIEPGAPLRELHERMLADDPALRARVPAAPPAVVARPVVVPAQLPPDTEGFAGRAAEVRLLTSGRSDPGPSGTGPTGAGPSGTGPTGTAAVWVSMISGPGGIGKSALAVHVAHRMRARYPDGQLFVRLHGGAPQPVPAAEALTRLLLDLGVHRTQVPDDAERRAGLFRSLLADRRMLLVFDDARDTGQVLPLLPGGSGCRVLVTSRAPLNLPGAQPIALDALPEPDALALLAGFAGSARLAADPAAAKRVTAACAGLPLALRIAGGRLARRSGWSVRLLADRLADERRRLDELSLGDLAVRSSFQASYDHLPRSAAGSPAVGVDPARAFRLLALPDSADIDPPAAAALLDVPPDAAERVLEGLVDRCLLETPMAGRYRFHDLLRLFARERAAVEDSAADRRAALERLVGHATATAANAVAVLTAAPLITFRPVPVPGRTFGTAQAARDWLDRESANLTALAEQAATAGLDLELAGSLICRLGILRYDRGGWDRMTRSAEVLLTAARDAGHQRAEAIALTLLGVLDRRRRRRVAAIERLRQARDGYRRLGDRGGAAWARSVLASAYGMNGQWRLALRGMEDSLRLCRELGNRSAEAPILNNLAVALVRYAKYRTGADEAWRRDTVRAALGHAERALAVALEYGPSEVSCVRWCTIGALRCELGRFAEALEPLRHGYQLAVVQGNRVYQADALANLGRACEGLGRYEEAAQHCERAVTICQAIPHRYGEARALHWLARALDGLRQYDRATECLNQALDTYQRLGVPDVASVRDTMARRTATALSGPVA